MVRNFIGNTRFHWLTPLVSQQKNNAVIAGGLLLAVFLWGGSNAGTKWLVGVVAAHLDRWHSLPLRRAAVAGGAALDFVAG